MEAQRFIATEKVFAGIAVIGVLGLLTDLGFAALYRWRFSWQD
jgi:NitT/TauT family transport system permease protein